MSLPAQTFTGITQVKFDAITAAVKAKIGITITADDGQDAADGFTISWTYSPDSETLIIQVLDKPWWAPDGTVQSQISNLINNA
jgi:hypothetical protein